MIRNEILNSMQQLHLSVRTLQSMPDFVKETIGSPDMQELEVDDLLGREAVQPSQHLLSKNISHKVVLVTGAGGTIGSELCRQIIKNKPKKLLLVEHSELSLYTIHQELIENFQTVDVEIIPLLGSIQSKDLMQEIMRIWRPNTVYHAAAYKHVPMVEHNIIEGINNNVFGTLNVAMSASEYDVSDFILISTDKALKPTNVMGATKRLSEMVIQALAPIRHNTKFAIVRFGNVLGSSGSVIQKFRRQINNGGPVTITHPEITRYFITISEAVQLIMQAGAMAESGELFSLDMGRAVKIIELAKRVIELSGFTVKDNKSGEGDIAIVVIGLRPGEKLYEELFIGDNPLPTSHPKILKVNEDYLNWTTLKNKLERLEIILKENNIAASMSFLKQMISGYAPESEIVDWMHIEQKSKKID